MDIDFKDNELEKLANDDRKRLAVMGQARAKKYKQRLDDLHGATTLEDLRNVAGKYHELVGNRKGQWGCSLDGPYRLVFKPQKIPIPTDPNGKYIWSEIKAITIIEIDNYHGK
jgi:toxin HigB-1